ncbi:hypothetical protein Tco_1252415 [Tanacetum coccineum]
MDNPNITMEEYIRLEEEKACRRGKVYNWETAMYGKIWDNEDVHDLGSIETEFPAIVFNDTLTSKSALSCELTVSSLNNDEINFRISFDESDVEDYMVIFDKNSFSYKIKTDSKNDNDKVNMPSLLSPELTVNYFDYLDFFKDFENEFPPIVYNNAQTSKSDLLTEPILSPQHIDEFDLKDESSLSECDEEEQNVLNFNDLFPFNVIYPNDSKSDKDNDDDKVDIEHSSGDLSLKPLPDVINIDDGAYAHGVLYKVEDIATCLVEYVKFWDDWEVHRYGNANLDDDGEELVETKAKEHNTLLKKGRIGNNTNGYMSFLANKKVSAITNKKPTGKEFQNIEDLESNDGNTIGFNNNQKKELCSVSKSTTKNLIDEATDEEFNEYENFNEDFVSLFDEEANEDADSSDVIQVSHYISSNKILS